jgi:hypothetical protein
MSPVADYCARFKASGATASEFARIAMIYLPELCLKVLDAIGMWPSSEPELRALQKRHF